MPKKKNWWAYLATLGPIGYFGAPGTVATFITLPCVYGLDAYVQNSGAYIIIVIVACIMSLMVINQALPCFDCHDDPSEIVLDEVIGCLLTFWMIPLSTQSVIVGFVLFRVLDIIKFGWIRRAESLGGAWGIMSDDLVAAIIANLILRALYY